LSREKRKGTTREKEMGGLSAFPSQGGRPEGAVDWNPLRRNYFKNYGGEGKYVQLTQTEPRKHQKIDASPLNSTESKGATSEKFS